MYDISLPQINMFLVSAEKLSFTEAAGALYITQSAVSKNIQNLESKLGVALFIRGKKRLSLTWEGEYLYNEWKNAVAEICRGIDAVHMSSERVSGELRIGCLHGFDFDGFLPGRIKAFEEKFPETNVSAAFYGFRDLRESLLKNDADVVITADFSLDNSRDIEYEAIYNLPLFIALSAAHPLASRERLDLSDLKDETFYQISPDESRLAVEKALKTCRNVGFTPKKMIYVPNVPSLAMALKHGAGVAICGDEIYKGNEKFIKLYSSPELPSDAFIVLAWKKSGTSATAYRFIEMALASGGESVE